MPRYKGLCKGGGGTRGTVHANAVDPAAVGLITESAAGGKQQTAAMAIEQVKFFETQLANAVQSEGFRAVRAQTLPWAIVHQAKGAKGKYHMLGLLAAQSGDLACTYGQIVQREGAPSHNYARIWQLTPAGWRIATETWSPVVATATTQTAGL